MAKPAKEGPLIDRGVYRLIDDGSSVQDSHSVSVDRSQGDLLVQVRVSWKAVTALVMVGLPGALDLLFQHVHLN